MRCAPLPGPAAPVRHARTRTVRGRVRPAAITPARPAALTASNHACCRASAGPARRLHRGHRHVLTAKAVSWRGIAASQPGWADPSRRCRACCAGPPSRRRWLCREAEQRCARIDRAADTSPSAPLSAPLTTLAWAWTAGQGRGCGTATFRGDRLVWALIVALAAAVCFARRDHLLLGRRTPHVLRIRPRSRPATAIASRHRHRAIMPSSCRQPPVFDRILGAV